MIIVDNEAQRLIKSLEIIWSSQYLIIQSTNNLYGLNYT